MQMDNGKIPVIGFQPLVLRTETAGLLRSFGRNGISLLPPELGQTHKKIIMKINLEIAS
jgi:hypothetical protein